MNRFKYLATLLILVLPGVSLAQESSEVSSAGFFEQYLVEIVLALAVFVCIVAVLAMFTTLTAMRVILRAKYEAEGVVVEEPELIPAREGEEGLPFWAKFWDRFNAAVPLKKEATVATDHEYDGIRELDNRLPPWWLYGFYFTIIFGVGYLLNYHVFNTSPLQDEEFQAEMIRAEEEVKVYLASLDNLIDETNVELVTEAAALTSGEAIYQKNCAVCHANDGGGGVGPNFTDQYWLHGGDIKSIFKTIKYGVPAKGMISWETQLSPKDMQDVASFIVTLEGTTPANPKDPQGEK
jgi:cytochrome c oxidase cbb3-type subunit 3